MNTLTTPPIDQDVNIAHEMALDYDRHWEVARRKASELGLHALAAHALQAGETSMDELTQEVTTPRLDSVPTPQEIGGTNRNRLNITARTFEEAANRKKVPSDTFIRSALADTFIIGGEKAFQVKGYLDNVPLDESDKAFIDHPELIANLYSNEISMIRQSLKMFAVDGKEDGALQYGGSVLKQIVSRGKTTPAFLDAWVHGGKTDGISGGLRWGLPDQSNLGALDGMRPNLCVQDQIFGVAVMAYSDKRTEEKIDGRESTDFTKRVYLNPRITDAPEIFSELLQSFNEQGLSVQMKMWGREGDLLKKAKAKEAEGYIRGDGMVVYVKDDEADKVLSLVLQMAEQHAGAFVGRQLTRIPVKVAEGIGVGEEPSNAPGTSLTSHRADFLEHLVHHTKQSKLTGQAAIDYFRKLLIKDAPAWNINPNNLAFNQRTS